jgi:CheY-like chemotaxis protein
VHDTVKERQGEGAGRGQRTETLIYVVDDEPMLLELASAILEPLGFAVETFRSPESAQLAFEMSERKPALIVTDYAMHTMTGLQLAEACRRLRPEQKVLLISGTVGTDSFDDGPVQPDRFLPKPYQADELVEAVKAVLGVG